LETLLLYDYIHRGISQEEYTERFNPEISSRPKAQKALAELRRKHNQGQTITLLCKCKEEEFCNSHLVKQMIIQGMSNKLCQSGVSFPPSYYEAPTKEQNVNGRKVNSRSCSYKDRLALSEARLHA
jgi:hypothetical protein